MESVRKQPDAQYTHRHTRKQNPNTTLKIPVVFYLRDKHKHADPENTG